MSSMERHSSWHRSGHWRHREMGTVPRSARTRGTVPIFHGPVCDAGGVLLPDPARAVWPGRLPSVCLPPFRPRAEIGLTTEAKERTESGEVAIPLRTLQILCVLCGSMSDLGPCENNSRAVVETNRSQKSEVRMQKAEVRAAEPKPVVSWCLGGKDPIRVLSRLAALGAASCLLAGCVGAGRVEPASAFARLEPEATVELGSPAAAICQDGEGLLVLENSGTRVIRYTMALSILDTIPLTERVTAPAGIAADRFYIYIYDDRTLYRTSRDKLNLQPWVGDVRVAGLIEQLLAVLVARP